MGLARRLCSTAPAACQDAGDETAAGRITTLPAELLEHIVGSACRSSWLSLFRTCKQLRDAVLANAAAGWTKELKTQLYLAPAGLKSHHIKSWQKLPHTITGTYLMADSGSQKLLQDMATDTSQSYIPCLGANTLHLDVFGPIGWQLQPVRLEEAQSWVSFLFSNTLTSPAAALVLQHVTELQLYSLQLQHPMPDVILIACPVIRRYRLEEVTWPEHVTASIKVWSHLQHLELYHTTTEHMALLFNSTNLPSVSELDIFPDSLVPDTLNRSQAIADCCKSFSSRLVHLNVAGFHNLAPFMSSQTFMTFPVLKRVFFGGHVQDQQFLALLAALPCLEHFMAYDLSLTTNHQDITCGLRNFTILRSLLDTDSMASPNNPVVAMGRLPHMPMLQTMHLPPLFVPELAIAAEHISETVEALRCLPVVKGYFRLSLAKKDALNFDASLMAAYIPTIRMLGPLLQLLCEKMEGIEIWEEATESLLRVLSEACMPRICLNPYRLLEPAVCQQLWTWMPHLHHITIRNPIGMNSTVDVILALCRAATRPVTVKGELKAEHYKQVSDALKAEGRLFLDNTKECEFVMQDV